MILHFKAVNHGAFTSYETELFGQKVVMAKAMTGNRALPPEFDVETDKLSPPARIFAAVRTATNGKQYVNLYLTNKAAEKKPEKAADTFAVVAPDCDLPF